MLKWFFNFLFIFVILISCSKNKPQISESYIKKLSNGDFAVPSVHSFDLLFVSSDSKQLAETNVGTLHYAYEKHFASDYDTFYDFLNAAFNKNLIIPRTILEHGQVEIFNLDKNIEITYKNAPMNLFLNKYCRLNNSGGYWLNEFAFSSGSIRSILYYLFVNNYKIRMLDSPESFSIDPIKNTIK